MKPLMQFGATMSQPWDCPICHAHAPWPNMVPPKYDLYPGQVEMCTGCGRYFVVTDEKTLREPSIGERFVIEVKFRDEMDSWLRVMAAHQNPAF